ncbi:hypothetical protein [Metallumcola ferriviriculae]
MKQTPEQEVKRRLEMLGLTRNVVKSIKAEVKKGNRDKKQVQ